MMYYQLFPAISTISKNSDGFEKISNISIHFSMLAIFIEHLSIELSMFKSQFYLYVYIYIFTSPKWAATIIIIIWE